MFPPVLMSCWNPEIASQIYHFKWHRSQPSHRDTVMHTHHFLFLKTMKNLSSVTLGLFSGPEIKIMFTEKNIAFTWVFKEK